MTVTALRSAFLNADPTVAQVDRRERPAPQNDRAVDGKILTSFLNMADGVSGNALAEEFVTAYTNSLLQQVIPGFRLDPPSVRELRARQLAIQQRELEQKEAAFRVRDIIGIIADGADAPIGAWTGNAEDTATVREMLGAGFGQSVDLSVGNLIDSPEILQQASAILDQATGGRIGALSTRDILLSDIGPLVSAAQQRPEERATERLKGELEGLKAEETKAEKVGEFVSGGSAQFKAFEAALSQLESVTDKDLQTAGIGDLFGLIPSDAVTDPTAANELMTLAAGQFGRGEGAGTMFNAFLQSEFSDDLRTVLDAATTETGDIDTSNPVAGVYVAWLSDIAAVQGTSLSDVVTRQVGGKATHVSLPMLLLAQQQRALAAQQRQEQASP